MTSWHDVEHEAPALADVVRSRLEAHGLALLATLRADGWPRLSGIEAFFGDGELWLGMMPGSRKAADLRRDPRLALHNATVDKAVTDGDVKITGKALEVTDPTVHDRVRAIVLERTGHEPPPGPMVLFSVDVTELASVRPVVDHLEIRSWRPGQPVRVLDRY